MYWYSQLSSAYRLLSAKLPGWRTHRSTIILNVRTSGVKILLSFAKAEFIFSSIYRRLDSLALLMDLVLDSDETAPVYS